MAAEQMPLEEVKRAFSVDRFLDIVESAGLKVRRGQKARCACPARCSTDPRACTVWDDGGAAFDCKHGNCDAAGSIVDLFMHLDGLAQDEAIKRARELAGSPWTPPVRRARRVEEDRSRIDVQEIWASFRREGARERAYVRGRSLEPAFDKGLCLVNDGSGPDGWTRWAAQKGYRLAIGIRNAFGEIVSFQLRAVGPVGDMPTKLSLKGPSYGDQGFLGDPVAARRAPRVFVTEGIADTLSVWQQGGVVVGCVGIDLLGGVLTALGNVRGRQVVLLPQNDAKGQSQTAYAKFERELRGRGADVRIVRTPAGYKDPAEWNHGAGPAAFWEAVCAAAEVVPLPTAEAAAPAKEERPPAPVVDIRPPKPSDPPDNGNGGGSGGGAQETEERPVIQITPEERDVNDAAVRALAKRDDALFQRSNSLVIIVRDLDAKAKAKNIQREPESPRIVALPSPVLRERMAAAAIWEKYSKTDEKWVPAHPPEWAVKAVHARGAWERVRHLRGLVEAPCLRRDGSVLQTSGYDPESGLFFEASEDFLPVPEHPTREDALKALEELLEVVVDFPIAKDMHRAAWVAAMLTPSARHAFNGPVPCTFVGGNIRGSGKTLLLDAVSVAHTGRKLPRVPYTTDDVEMQKKITSIALAGDQMAFFDNVLNGGAFGSPALDAALTSTTWADRLLSTNMKPTLPLYTMFFSTGNNVRFVGDIVRRMLLIELVSDEEHPEDRNDFKHPDLLDWVLQERPRLIRACLTILRAFHVAGRPEPTPRAPSWGSYEAWSSLVRNAVIWLGMADPWQAKREAESTSDTDAMNRAAIVEGLHELLRETSRLGTGMTVKQMLTTLETDTRIAETPPKREEKFTILRGVFDVIAPAKKSKDIYDARAIGDKLRAMKNQRLGGLTLVPNGESHHTTIWTVIGGSGGSGGSVSTNAGKNQESAGPEIDQASAGNDPPRPPDPPQSTLFDAQPPRPPPRGPFPVNPDDSDVWPEGRD
jgi:hypothetical protein